MAEIKTMDDVIAALDSIILDAETNNDTAGFFAALYRKVTVKVKEGIANNAFEDGERMARLDVVFAKRYLDAYAAWKRNEPTTASWQKTFEMKGNFWPIVLQHLLMGMNAHINLDLGIAAAEVSKGYQINALQHDFNKINSILSALVMEVQDNLSAIWPRLKWILQKTKNADDFFVDWSMQLSRDGAWKFALGLAANPDAYLNLLIAERDKKVAAKSKIVLNTRLVPKLVFAIIRLGERGSVKDKIASLK